MITIALALQIASVENKVNMWKDWSLVLVY